MHSSDDETPTISHASAKTFAFDAPDGSPDRQTSRDSDETQERYGPADLLGEGGLGRVFLVPDRVLGRSVAKKVLKHRGSGRVRGRFVREAKITAQLEHPGIIPVYDSGTADGEPFYTMKHVRGRSLAECIEDANGLSGRLEWVDALVQVSDAIACAHSRGVVHRDLKPENVMVGEFGECLVLDWGLASPMDRDEDTSESPGLELSDSFRSRVGRISGTPAYMAPEQALGKPAAPPADLFALGAILYEILTGESPYGYIEGIERTLKAAAAGQWRPIRSIAPEAPAELVAIAERALCSEPDARYPSARAFGAELRRWIRGRKVHAYPYSPVELLMRFARQHAGYLALAGIAVAVSVALVITGVTSTLVTMTAGYHSTRDALADANLVLATKALENDEITMAHTLAQQVLAVREDPEARGVLAATTAVTHLEPIETIARPCSFLRSSAEGLLCLNDGTLSLLAPDIESARWSVPSGTSFSALSSRQVAVMDGQRAALMVHDLMDGRLAHDLEMRHSAVFEPDGTLRSYARGAGERHGPDGEEPIESHASLPLHWSTFDGGEVLVTVSGAIRRTDAEGDTTIRSPVSPVSDVLVHEDQLWIYGDGIARYPRDLSSEPVVEATGGRVFELQSMKGQRLARRRDGSLWMQDANGMALELAGSFKSFAVMDDLDLWTTDGQDLTRWRFTGGRSRGLHNRGKATGLIASPNGRWLATCHYDQPARVYAFPSLELAWEHPTETPLCTWIGPETFTAYVMDRGSRTNGSRVEWAPETTRIVEAPAGLEVHLMLGDLLASSTETLTLYDADGTLAYTPPTTGQFVQPDRLWADGTLTDLRGNVLRAMETAPTYASAEWVVTPVDGGSVLQTVDGSTPCSMPRVRLAAENDAWVAVAYPDDTIAVFRNTAVRDGQCTPRARIASARDHLYKLTMTETHVVAASWDGDVRVYALDALTAASP